MTDAHITGWPNFRTHVAAMTVYGVGGIKSIKPPANKIGFSAANKFCLLNCGTKLTRKNISRTHAIKACCVCKRKFTFVRTDTKMGLALLARMRYDKRRVREDPKYDC